MDIALGLIEWVFGFFSEQWQGIIIGALAMWVSLRVPIIGHILGALIIGAFLAWTGQRRREPNAEPSELSGPVPERKKLRPLASLLRGRLIFKE